MKLKKWLWVLFIIITACSNLPDEVAVTDTPGVTPSKTASSTKTPTLTVGLSLQGTVAAHLTQNASNIATKNALSTVIALTPTKPKPTPGPTLTSSPIPTPVIGWGEWFEPPKIFTNHYYGTWSPTANEMLFYCDEKKMDNRIIKVAEPDFIPEVISPEDFECSLFTWDELMWTQDGENILFSGRLPEDHNLADNLEISDIWIMGRDGENPHRIDPLGISSSWLNFGGWLDKNTFVKLDYGKGGHWGLTLIEYITGERIAWAFFYGTPHLPGKDYVAAATGDPPIHRVFVISKTPQSAVFEFVESKFVRPIPEFLDQNEHTFFEGWIEGTNKMVVYLYLYKENGLEKTHLLRWDVDTNVVKLVAPNGLGGKISQDGRYLAYVTYGPAKLDSTLAPMDFEYEQDPQELPVYLQLLDMESNLVFLSLPVLAMVDETNFFPHHLPKSSFSPNGQFFAFVTDAELDISEGWPIGGIDGEATNMYIVDLNTRQLILSLPVSSLPSWSHGSDKFIYNDGEGNLVLYDLTFGISLPITKSVDDIRIWPLSWSYDDRYVSLWIIDSSNQSNIGIMRVP
jgi:Tol biopolymer transport system component